MKLNILPIIILALLSTASLAGGGKSEKLNYQDGTYIIDPAHTRASFSIAHFVISKVEGRFNEVTGTIKFDKDFTKSSFEATIPVSSIDSAVEKRDNHLKSPDFFDAKKFPLMTFKSTEISGDKHEFELTGDLTIKDVTKEVVFEGKYLGLVTDSWGNKRAAFKLKTKINRKDFDINYSDKFDLGPVVGHEVKIKIISEVTLKK